jgi:hypothetical protein
LLGRLADGRWHSTIEFVELGILRAAARVHELRRRGFAIEVRRIERRDRSPVWAYRLVSVRLDAAPLQPPMLASRAEADEPAYSQLELGDTVTTPFPSEPAREEPELPSAEERRRIAAEARAAFEIAMGRKTA